MSSGPSETAGAARPRKRSSSSARSTVPSQAIRCTPAKIRSSERVWYSSSEVVITVRTALSPTTAAATSRYSPCRHTSTVAPESCSNPSSSRSRFIGLIDTAMPPAFQVPIWAITNWGTFCR